MLAAALLGCGGASRPPPVQPDPPIGEPPLEQPPVDQPPVPDPPIGEPTDGEPPPEEPPPPSEHLLLGTPTDATPDDDLLLLREHMAIGYSPYLNAANWVSWRTVPEDFGSAPRYSGSFLSDKELPAGLYRPIHDDYTNSGFDRGHMVRSEERTSSPAANKATFVLSNILPQTEDLNRGPWYDLERLVEEKVHPTTAANAATVPKDAYVIAGAVWPAACATHQPRRAGDGCRDLGKKAAPAQRIAVPEATFKIVVFVDAGLPVTSSPREVIAVLMPNLAGIRTKPWTAYQTTVEEIERRTGYQLLSRLP
jgi:endonuclease G